MMKPQRSNVLWILAGVVLGGLGAGAAALSQGGPELSAPAQAAAQDLSTAFRQAAQTALPAVVSIEVRTKAVEVEGGENVQAPFNDPLFREFFGGDERFQDLFRNRRIPPRRGKGSGFIIDPSGIILTNSHVVESADKVIVKLHDGRELAGKSWDADPRTDLAIIRVESDAPLTALPLGNSDAMQIGDWVLAMGNPFDVGVTVTAGIISATGRGPGINERESYLQTDAAINPGNSGGPLVNLKGEAVGINTAISTRSGGYDGVGFAIPIDMARWVADQLVREGKVHRAYLGVALQEIDNDLRQQFELGVGVGALVSQVFPESPAADAGMQAGDIILEFAGKSIGAGSQLQAIVETLTIGKTYEAVVRRNGEKITLSVTLREMPGDFTSAMRRAQPEEAPRQEESPESHFGISVTALTPDLARRLQIPATAAGVLVSAVEPGSAAATAGLREGDLIQKVGSQTVSSPAEFEQAADQLKLEEGVLLLVRRGAGSTFVVLKPVD